MDELLKLPGVNEETAAKAVSLREMLGGFNSVQEFIDMTHIEPQYVDQIREKATIREQNKILKVSGNNIIFSLTFCVNLKYKSLILICFT